MADGQDRWELGENVSNSPPGHFGDCATLVCEKITDRKKSLLANRQLVSLIDLGEIRVSLNPM